MTLFNIVSLKCIKIDSEGKNKTEILKEIASLAKNSNMLKKHSEDEIFNALSKRESIGSTGFYNSIAIPHCSFDNLEDFVIGILINKNGVDFDSIDGKKTKIFFFIISPSNQRNKHIQILSSISRFLNNLNNVIKLLNTKDNVELTNVISDHSENIEEKNISKNEKVLFHVFIQKEKYFDDILQIFSELVDGSITVVETVNAGNFLYSLPIFSSFWTEEKKKYSRVIIAVVNKNISNNIIRNINTLIKDIEKESGVLITANEVFYTNGKIDF